MINFAKRNLKIFFRDKTAVFFSLLAVFIVIGLYVLFLGDSLVSSMGDIEGARYLMDSWIMAGILAVTPVSTILGSFGTMVDDKTKKIYKDFRCSPMKSSSIAGGYILSSFCVGIIMTVLAFILAEFYIVISGGELLPFVSILKILGVIVLTVIASSSMMYFIVSLINSQSAFTTVSTVIGTLIGFITGIYLPVGSTPEFVQYIIKLFPISHSASLFRKIFMEDPMAQSFDGIPEKYITEFKIELGIEFKINDWEISNLESIIFLLITTVVFYAIGIVITNRKKEK